MSDFPWSTLFWGQSLAAGIISALLAVYLGRYRRIPEARPLFFLMCAVSIWSFAYALELRSTELAVKLFWVRMEYAGAAFVGFLVAVFSLRMVGKAGRFSLPMLFAAGLIPILTVIGAATNDVHGLVWSDAWLEGFGDTSLVAYVRGPLFWTHIAYSYGLLALTTLLLAQAWAKSKGIHRKQIIVILLALMAPWIANALYLTGIPAFSRVDFTPLAFTVSGSILAYGLLGYGLLDLLPVAREAVLENMTDAVLVLDTHDRLVDLNASAAALADLPPSQIIGQPAREALPTLFPYLDRHSEDRTFEAEIGLTANGERREFELRISSLFHGRHHLAGRVVILRDITERTQARKSLQFTQFAIDHFSEAAFWLNPEGRFIYVNEAACRTLGYSRDELLGMRPEDVTQDFTLTTKKRVWADMCAHGFKAFESLLRHRDGRRVPVEISANLLEFKGDHFTCAFIRDITWRKEAEKKQKRLESRLEQAHKMEAIGTMAGGVAHDLNNILSGIVTYPDLMLLQLPQESPLRKPILTIRESGHKAAAIVQDLLTLARRGVRNDKVIRLEQVIEGYLHSPEHEKLLAYHPGVQVEDRIEEDLPTLKGSDVHLHKVVMNLVSNAAEAMPEGGKIVLSLQDIYLATPIRGYDHIREGTYLRLSVSDDGIGIPPEEQDLIFAPFYTKKIMGRSGTGLGMAVVWSTVRDHGGYIDVESEPGNGTAFHLYFPAGHEPVRDESSGPGAGIPEGRGESVLVVDDVREQREIARAILTQLGYHAVAVAGGEEAVAFMEGRAVDLLLLDMIMDPGMDGLETYERILRVRPGQKAILVSGYSENDRVQKALELGAGAYVKKPYTIESLGRAVRNELEKSSPSGTALRIALADG